MYAAPTTAVKNGKFTLNTRWRLTEPVLTINFRGQYWMKSHKQEVRYKREYNLDAVYAGKGAPEDYNGLDVKVRQLSLIAVMKSQARTCCGSVCSRCKIINYRKRWTERIK